MARPTPTVGFGAGFDAATFRTAIRNAMVMGMPNATGEKVTFRWTPSFTYDPQDPQHDPYSWSQTATPTFSHADVIVPCALEFTAPRVGSAGGETDIGEFDLTRAVITVIDTDYALIRGADLAVIDGAVYEVTFVAPPVGLFEVTIYQIFARSRDEA